MSKDQNRTSDGKFKKGHTLYSKGDPRKKRVGPNNNKFKGGQITLICMVCESDFQVDPYRKNTAKTCSVTCYNELRKQPEYRMVKSELFRKIAEEQLGAVRSYITSLDKTIRKSVQYKIWRDTIFKRDDYTCQNCEVKGGTLRADHIKQFALILFENDVRTFEEALLCAQLWDVKNGRTLCDECHKNTSTYGQKVINLNHQPL